MAELYTFKIVLNNINAEKLLTVVVPVGNKEMHWERMTGVQNTKE